MARFCEGCVNAPAGGMEDIAAVKMTTVASEQSVVAVQVADDNGVRSHPFLLHAAGNREQQTERLLNSIESCPGAFLPTLEDCYRGRIALCQAADVEPYSKVQGMQLGDCIKTLVTLSHEQFVPIQRDLMLPERV